MQRPSTRRRFLHGTTLIGIAATAGCVSQLQSNSDGTETAQKKRNQTDSRATSEASQRIESPTPSENLTEWLANADNFDGEIIDKTDAETVTVTVGAKSGERHLAFAPPAIQIATGTTVKWKWSGEGGGHNIVFPDTAISSSQIHAESGVHFQRSFQQTGTYRYKCDPHADFGEKGAIVVV